jgi:hypothetical protein
VVDVAAALRTSSSTRSAFRAIAAAEPAPAAVMTWARGSTIFPAAQTPGTLGSLDGGEDVGRGDELHEVAGPLTNDLGVSDGAPTPIATTSY